MAEQSIPYEAAAGPKSTLDESVPYEDAAAAPDSNEDVTGNKPWSDLPSNLGPSAGRFIGNLTYPFLHTSDFLHGIKQVATDPDTQKAVLQFYKDRYGGLDNIRNTVITDPVGAAADFAGILSGGELTAEKAAATLGKLGAARAAGALGTTADVLGKVGSAIDPVANTGRALNAGKFVAGKTYNGVLGLTTLKGPGAFSDAAAAGWRGNTAFMDNLNKKVPIESLVDTMQNAFNTVKQNAQSYYRDNFPQLKTPISTTPIHNTWSTLTNSPELVETPASKESSAWAAMSGVKQPGHPNYQFNERPVNPVTGLTTESGLVKGSQSFADQMQSVKDLVDKYTTKPQTLWIEDHKQEPFQLTDGTKFQPGNWQTVNVPSPRNIFDLDALKQALSDVQAEASNPKVKMVAGRMRDAVKAQISDVHPGYADTMEKYAQAQQMLDDIRQTFGVGSDKTAMGTKLNKIGRIYSETPAGERSGELFDQLEQQTGVPLRASIAGQRLSNWLPLDNSPAKMIVEGLGAKEAFGALGAKALAALPITSPKMMGAMTYGANRAAGIIGRNYANNPYLPSMRRVGQVAVQASRPSELANDPEEIARIRAEQAAGIQ